MPSLPAQSFADKHWNGTPDWAFRFLGGMVLCKLWILGRRGQGRGKVGKGCYPDQGVAAWRNLRREFLHSRRRVRRSLGYARDDRVSCRAGVYARRFCVGCCLMRRDQGLTLRCKRKRWEWRRLHCNHGFIYCRFATPPHPTSRSLGHLLLKEKAWRPTAERATARVAPTREGGRKRFGRNETGCVG